MWAAYCGALKAAEGQPLNAGRSRRQGGVGEAVPTGGRPARAPPRGGEPHQLCSGRWRLGWWVYCTGSLEESMGRSAGRFILPPKLSTELRLSSVGAAVEVPHCLAHLCGHAALRLKKLPDRAAKGHEALGPSWRGRPTARAESEAVHGWRSRACLVVWVLKVPSFPCTLSHLSQQWEWCASWGAHGVAGRLTRAARCDRATRREWRAGPSDRAAQ
eukprot:scaffold62837_cov60-Phaeocystis_antarctica.AAC.2